MTDADRKQLQKVLDQVRVARGEFRKVLRLDLIGKDEKRAEEAQDHIEKAICVLYFWLMDLKDKEKEDGGRVGDVARADEGVD